VEQWYSLQRFFLEFRALLFVIAGILVVMEKS
jgi:hypothetical protein